MNGDQTLNQPAAPAPAPPRPGGGKSWVGWLVGILLVIIVGGGLYYYYQYTKVPQLQGEIDRLSQEVQDLQNQLNEQETDETANWGTYTNERYGYSIKYPSDWEVQVVGQDNSEAANTNSERVSFVKDNMQYIIIYKSNQSSTSTAVNDYKATLSNPEESEANLGNETATKVSGNKSSNVPGEGEKVAYYIFTKGSNVMVIQVNMEKDYNSLKDTIDKMLETFEFTS